VGTEGFMLTPRARRSVAFWPRRAEESRPCRHSAHPNLLLRISPPKRVLPAPDQACRSAWTSGFMLTPRARRSVAFWPRRAEESRACRHSARPKPTFGNISLKTRSTRVKPKPAHYIYLGLRADGVPAVSSCVSVVSGRGSLSDREILAPGLGSALANISCSTRPTRKRPISA
jgi:hypothetical protein